MNYISTRNPATTYTLREAAFAGLAPDGGLFMPETIPAVDLAEVTRRADTSFVAMAEYLATLFFGDDMPAEALGRVCREAFDFEVPLIRLGDEASEADYILELFHGPTAAFKDFGARFMGRMMGRLRSDGERLVILVATSGDTGGAVAHGFLGVEGVDVVVLYPEGAVSDLQESQMTTLGGNVHALRVAGTFDDCQRMVKEVFADAPFRRTHSVTSANSINILRWIPQSFYYFWGRHQWCRDTGRDPLNDDSVPSVVVPSGNYGNLAAGMLARRMGLPLGRLVAASNANDIVPEWLHTGIYRPRASVATIASAMDVGAPSNHERMVNMAGLVGSVGSVGSGVAAILGRELVGFSSSDDEIRTSIRALYDRWGYVSDPHSAAGYNAWVHTHLDGFRLSTAAAAKFGDVITPELGFEPAIPPRLAQFLGRPKHSTPVVPAAEPLREHISAILKR